MKKPKDSILQKDKIRHKVISYFILRKLAKLMPLKVAIKLTHSLMASKELLDKTGLGTPEKDDVKANEIGIKEAADDITNKKLYRYKTNSKIILKDLLKYLHLKR